VADTLRCYHAIGAGMDDELFTALREAAPPHTARSAPRRWPAASRRGSPPRSHSALPCGHGCT
jgi:hypothetical protein